MLWLIKQNLSQIHAIVVVLSNLKECFESTFCGLILVSLHKYYGFIIYPSIIALSYSFLGHRQGSHTNINTHIHIYRKFGVYE